MALVKMGHEADIKDGERIVKECYDRCLVLLKRGESSFHALELPDTAFAQADVDKMQSVPGCRSHTTYRDSDGMLWVNLPTQVKPAVDKSFRAPPVGEGYGLGAAALGAADVPPPLVPFAGCDRKPMPPSPAKPFALAASPLKPSPFKERVDVATDAVVRKTWSSRQAKMGEFFAQRKPARPPVPCAPGGEVPAESS